MNVSAFFALLLFFANSISTTPASAQRTITVAGSATVKGVADMATVTIHIERREPGASADIQTMMSELRAAGIPPDDIERTSYSVVQVSSEPNMDTMMTAPAPVPAPAPPPPPAWMKKEMKKESASSKKEKHPRAVSNDEQEAPDTPVPPPPPIPPPAGSGVEIHATYHVKVRNLGAVDQVKNIARMYGKYNYKGVTPEYDLTNRSTLQLDALKQAMANAKQKAEFVARDMGVTLGEIVSINDADNAGAFSMGNLPEYFRMMTAMIGENEDPTQITEMSNVKVTYSVK